MEKMPAAAVLARYALPATRGCSRRIPSLASSRANKLISNASRSRCSADIARRISSWTACAAGLVSVWGTGEC
jgi:hypothetical protein